MTGDEPRERVVVHLAASPCLGGPESQLLGLVGHIGGGVRSAVLSFSEGGRCRALLDAARALGVEAVELTGNAPRYGTAAREVAGHLRRLRADVVCCHGYKPDLLGLLAARRAGVPAVSVSHGWTAATWKVRLNEAADRLSLFGMARVVCVSESQARRVRRVGVPSRKVVVIPNAVDPEKYETADSTERGRLLELFEERPRVLVGSVGRLSPEKGYGVLVEAAARVAAADPGVGFVHFGDGPLRSALTERVESLGLRGRFMFAGFRADVHKAFAHFDVFVLPSYTEGLPCVVLEAFAAGVPVVATAVGGTPEVVEDGVNGRLAPPGDSRALASRLAELIGDSRRRASMGERGRRLVLERFSFEGQAEAYRSLFEGLRASRAARPAVPFLNSSTQPFPPYQGGIEGGVFDRSGDHPGPKNPLQLPLGKGEGRTGT